MSYLVPMVAEEVYNNLPVSGQRKIKGHMTQRLDELRR